MLEFVNIFIVSISIFLSMKRQAIKSPLGLYLIMWLFTLLFLPFAESFYSYEVSNYFHFSFTLVSVINVIYIVSVPSVCVNHHMVFNSVFKHKLEIANNIILIVSFVWISLFVFDVFKKYSIIWMANPMELRYMFFDGRADTIVSISYCKIYLLISTLLSCVCLLVIGNKRKFYLPILFALFFSIAYLGRNEFVRTVLMYIFTLILVRCWSLKKIILTGFVVLSLLLVMSLFLGKTNDKSEVTNPVLSSLQLMGCYTSGSVIAFDNHMNRENNLTYGVSTLYPLLLRIGFSVIPPDYSLDYFDNINTFTYLRPFYDDFGFLGIIVFSVIFNYFLVSESVSGKRKRNIFHFATNIYLYPVALFSVQGFDFQSMETFLALLCSYFILLCCNYKFKLIK